MTRPPVAAGGGGIGGYFSRFSNFLSVYSIAVKWNIIEMFTRHRKLNLQVMPKRAGDTAIVTGGSRGLGADVVKQLMILDMHVIIGCRQEAAGIKLIDKLRKEGIQSGSAEVLRLDLDSFDSVRTFSQNLLDRNIPINILVNNAGIMFIPKKTTTVDGFESHLQTNYLSHFYLTNLLMPLLVNGGSPYRVSRVVNVSSIANFGGKIDFDDLNMDKVYDKHMAYMSSKLMQVVSAKDLNARLKADGKPVRVYSVHPGVIYTDLYDKIWLIQGFSCIVKKIFKTSEQGADGIVFVAASPEVETDGGEFFINCRKHTPNPRARDPSVQQKLWNISQNLVGLKSSVHNETIEIVTMT